MHIQILKNTRKASFTAGLYFSRKYSIAKKVFETTDVPLHRCKRVYLLFLLEQKMHKNIPKHRRLPFS